MEVIGFGRDAQERRADQEIEGDRPADCPWAQLEESQEKGTTGEDSQRTDEDCLWPLRQLECKSSEHYVLLFGLMPGCGRSHSPTAT